MMAITAVTTIGSVSLSTAGAVFSVTVFVALACATVAVSHRAHVGIAANFVLALSVPYAASSHRLFAGSYVVVVAVHTTLSVLEDGGVPPVVLATTAVVNGAAPTVVVIAALVAGDALMAWWAVAAVIAMTLSPLVRHLAPGRLSGPPAFTSRPERFVQRHGVLLLILLGEAVLTIGVGLGTAFRDLDREQVLVTLTSFAVAGTLCYAYFGERDDDAAYRELSRAARSGGP